MRIRSLSSVASVAALLGLLAIPTSQAFADNAAMIEKGKAISFHRQKGNCLTCHMIVGGEATGNIGPPLIAMKARFPDKKVLRAQIWDSTKANPASMMPPFGKHNILTEEEIDAVVEYIHSL